MTDVNNYSLKPSLSSQKIYANLNPIEKNIKYYFYKKWKSLKNKNFLKNQKTLEHNELKQKERIMKEKLLI